MRSVLTLHFFKIVSVKKTKANTSSRSNISASKSTRFRYYGRKPIKISACNIFIEKDIGYLYHGGGKLTGGVARPKEIP